MIPFYESVGIVIFDTPLVRYSLFQGFRVPLKSCILGVFPEAAPRTTLEGTLGRTFEDF